MRNNNNKNKWEEIRLKNVRKRKRFSHLKKYFYLSFCFSRFKRNLKTSRIVREFFVAIVDVILPLKEVNTIFFIVF